MKFKNIAKKSKPPQRRKPSLSTVEIRVLTQEEIDEIKIDAYRTIVMKGYLNSE